MNKWQLSAVVYARPVLNHNGNIPTLNFTVYWTEEIFQKGGKKRQGEFQRIDCSFPHPPEGLIEVLQPGVLAYLEGRPYEKRYTHATDGTEGWCQGMRVWWARKWEKDGSHLRTGPSEDRRRSADVEEEE